MKATTLLAAQRVRVQTKAVQAGPRANTNLGLPGSQRFSLLQPGQGPRPTTAHSGREQHARQRRGARSHALFRPLPRARPHPVRRARPSRDEPGVTRSDRQREKGALGPPRRGTYGLVHVYPSRPPAASQGRLRGSLLPVSPRRQTHHTFYGPSGAKLPRDPDKAVRRAGTAVRARKTDTKREVPIHGAEGLTGKQGAALHSRKHRKTPCRAWENRSQHQTSHAKRSQDRQLSETKVGGGCSAIGRFWQSSHGAVAPGQALPKPPYKLPPHIVASRPPPGDPTSNFQTGNLCTFGVQLTLDGCPSKPAAFPALVDCRWVVRGLATWALTSLSPQQPGP